MTLIFIILLLITLFFLSGVIFSIVENEPDIFFPSFCIMVVFGLLTMLPTAENKEFPIKNPEITFNTNGAIVAYQGKNYDVSDYQSVDGLKTGRAYPVLQKTYNFYGHEMNSTVIIKSGYQSVPPQDTPHE